MFLAALLIASCVCPAAWPQGLTTRPGGEQLRIDNLGRRIENLTDEVRRLRLQLERLIPPRVSPPVPKQPSLRLRGHAKYVAAVAASPDGKTAASGGYDLSLRQWDLRTGRELKKYQGQGAAAVVRDMAYTPDGQLLLLACGQYRGVQSLKIWDVNLWQERKQLEGHDNIVTSVAVSPDGKLAVSGSNDSTVRLWELPTGRPLRTLTGHTNGVSDVAFSPDGTLVASTSLDDTVRVWDVATGRQVRLLEGHRGDVFSVAFSPVRPLLLSGGTDRGTGTIRLWDLTTGQETGGLSGLPGTVRHVEFSPNGRLVLSCASGGAVRIQDVETGREVFRVPGDNPQATACFTPDGRQILVTDRDNTIEVWPAPQVSGDNAAR